MSETNLNILSNNLTGIKNMLNKVSDKLTLEEYDIIYGEIEHCQYLILELQEEKD